MHYIFYFILFFWKKKKLNDGHNLIDFMLYKWMAKAAICFAP